MDVISTRRGVLAGTAAGAAALALAGQPRLASAQAASPAASRGAAGGSGPIDKAMVEAALPGLLGLAEETVAAGLVPGLSLAVVFRDEVLVTAGFGVRSAAGDAPVDADTVFPLASMAKPLGSTVVSAIVGRGDATWDDAVIDHLPGFLLADPWATRELTIGDFYSHRSGLGGDAGGDLERVGYDRDAIVERLRFLELASSPRTHYAYSNIGLTVGGLAAAAATGMSWADASTALLYEPLGMTRTSSRYADYAAEANRAPLHVRIDGAWQPAFAFDSDSQAPAGGASSSANDMAQWLRLLLGDGTIGGEELIPAAPLLEARTPRMSTGHDPLTGEPMFYGYGWSMLYRRDGRYALRHAGAFSLGARTLVSLLPGDGLGIVVLTSAWPTGVPDGLSAALFDLVLLGEPSRDWVADWNAAYEMLAAAYGASGVPYEAAPEAPAPALPAAAYVGVYENSYAGPVEVVEEGGGLVLRLGPEPSAFALTHFDRDVFTWAIDLEPPAPLTGATFVVGPGGTASALLLDYFAGNGQGRFSRRAEG